MRPLRICKAFVMLIPLHGEGQSCTGKESPATVGRGVVYLFTFYLLRKAARLRTMFWIGDGEPASVVMIEGTTICGSTYLGR
jgi:hypothetical protein